MIGIIVAFPKPENAQMIQGLLKRSGFSVVSVCNTGAQVLSAVDDLSEGVVVCGYKFPDLMYNELKADLPEEFDMMLVAGRANLQEAMGQNIVCVEMPLKAQDMIDTLSMMVDTCERKKRKRRQMPKFRSEADKAVITQAKKLLMERNNLTEEEAHRYLQKMSMDTGTGLVEAAQMVMVASRY
ncbi:MAG: ANTAR domain-containing protein [Lachnospiraceae bacterium]|nr:ANTAR domain-containing protein [Lachnospiraceae bacterium]